MRIVTILILLLSSAFANADFLKAPAGYKYALVLVAPSQEGLTPEQKQVLNKAKGWIQDSLPSVLTSLGKVLVSSSGSKDVFLSTTQELREQLVAKLETVKDQLPKNEQFVQAYFIAWPEEELTQANMDSALGHPVIVLEQQEKLAQTYNLVNNSVLRTISTNYANGDRFQFAAAAIRLRLQRNSNILTLQVYGALNPGESEFIENSDEVELSTLVIPKAEIFPNNHVPYAPTVLLTIRQILQPEVIPTMDLDFGTFGGVAGDIASANGFSARGELSIFRDDISLGGVDNCHLKMATPILRGILGPKATGLPVIDDMAKGRDVQFRIFSARADMPSSQLESLDVRMDLGLLQCLSLEGVKKKFKDKANAAISSKLHSLYRQDDLTDKLMDELYRINVKQPAK